MKYMATSASIAKTVFVIGISFLLAIIVMLITVPPWLSYLRPQLVVLVLLYWTLYLPQRVGMMVAWCLGIMLDVLYDVTLGTHALSLVLVTYIALMWKVKFNFFVFWQKTILVFILVFLYFAPQFFMVFITGGKSFNVWLCFSSSLVSAVLWPYLTIIFNTISSRCNLS